jgi:hypothetical protein
MVHLLLDYKADPNHFDDEMCHCRPLHWHACRDNLFCGFVGNHGRGIKPDRKSNPIINLTTTLGPD